MVEVFKYPGTGNRIPPNSEDRYRMQQMIGLRGSPLLSLELQRTERRNPHQSAIVHCANTSCRTIHL